MSKIVLVWHGHHQHSSPLEVLSESFKERKNTIEYTKSRRETPRDIAIRKKLFKHVKGGLKALPLAFQRAYQKRLDTQKAYKVALDRYHKSGSAENSRLLDIASDAESKAYETFNEMVDKPSKGILKLHKEQCGCGWKPWPDNDILKYYTGPLKVK